MHTPDVVIDVHVLPCIVVVTMEIGYVYNMYLQLLHLFRHTAAAVMIHAKQMLF